MQGGTFDRKQGAVDFSGPLDADKKFLYRIVGMVRDSETQFRYDGDKSVPDIRQYVAPSLTWRPTEDTSLTILGDWLHNSIRRSLHAHIRESDLYADHDRRSELQ